MSPRSLVSHKCLSIWTEGTDSLLFDFIWKEKYLLKKGLKKSGNVAVIETESDTLITGRRKVHGRRALR